MSDYTTECPFCSHTMATYATVCAGCGATRYFYKVYPSEWGKFFNWFGIMLIGCIPATYLAATIGDFFWGLGVFILGTWFAFSCAGDGELRSSSWSR